MTVYNSAGMPAEFETDADGNRLYTSKILVKPEPTTTLTPAQVDLLNRLYEQNHPAESTLPGESNQELAALFGPGSNSRAANDLAKRDIQRYRTLRAAAIRSGIKV